MNPKLGAAISVVRISDAVLEFFKSNSREQIRIRVKDDIIMEIVDNLDGTKSIDEIAAIYNIDVESVKHLIDFLRQKGVLDNIDPDEDFEDYYKFRRTINFISDYSQSHDHLIKMWNNIRKSTVMIIGLGAVGSWVACNLVQSGVKNLILMDADIVDITNIHRQFGYTEDQVGNMKTDALEKRLNEYVSDLNITKINKYLTCDILNELNNTPIDLIINCADKPNVDTTSLWVGKYGMEHNIPHIVGGGYNLHLSLIGQTVIPGKCACVKCFQKQLEEENKIDSKRVKKLAVKNRKVGSFGPMCAIIASMIGMEAIKVISKEITPANMNRRGELNIYTMDITYKEFKRRKDCEWCGENGIYNRQKCFSK